LGAGHVNILGSLFGCLYLLPQAGRQYLISVGLCMDEALSCTLGFLCSIVRDRPKLVYPLLGFVDAHFQTSKEWLNRESHFPAWLSARRLFNTRAKQKKTVPDEPTNQKNEDCAWSRQTVKQAAATSS